MEDTLNETNKAYDNSKKRRTQGKNPGADKRVGHAPYVFYNTAFYAPFVGRHIYPEE
jgi:hypothetical protein